MSDSKRHRILLVDDHPMLRVGLAVLINASPDFVVCGEADSVEPAFALVQSAKPDLVILDFELKGASGLDLLSRLAESQTRVPALMFSMHDETLFALRALKAGASGYVMKRETPAHLLNEARRIFAGEVAVSTAVAQLLLRNVTAKRPAHDDLVHHLSEREFEVFMLIGQGYSTAQIADQLKLGQKTIETHRTHIKDKLSLPTAAELVRHAALWVVESRKSR